jgi:hypothetical protein
MFEWMSNRFEKIIVTGPQRSGTTICARMIAQDTRYRFVIEMDIGVNDLDRLRDLVEHNTFFVVQCPALCRYVHEFSAPDVGIVLMRRDIQDILASKERINWNGTQEELERYGVTCGVSAEVKYHYWDTYQKWVIQNPIEIPYEALSIHPLWVPKALRVNFEPHQTSLEDTTR